LLAEMRDSRLKTGRPLLAEVMRRASLAGHGAMPEDYLTDLSLEQRQMVLFAVVEELNGGQVYSFLHRYFRALLAEPIGLSTEEVSALISMDSPQLDHAGFRTDLFHYLVVSTAQLQRDQAPGAADLVAHLAEHVLGWNVQSHYGRESQFREKVAQIRDAALSLWGRPPPSDDEGPVSRDDAYGRALMERLGPVADWPSGVRALLDHCAEAGSAKPSSKWERILTERLNAVTESSELVHELLELVVATEPIIFMTDHGRRPQLLNWNDDLVRGLVWAAGVLDEEWMAATLQRVAERCLRLSYGRSLRETAVKGEKVPFACFFSLGRSDSDAAPLALARIARSTSNRTVLKRLYGHLEEAAFRRGVSTDTLLEYGSPDHGLDATGRLELSLGAFRARIELDDGAGATLTWDEDGDADPGPAELAEATQVVSEIRDTVTSERERLEGLLVQNREWHVDDFRACYVLHPVTGWMSRRLAWSFETGKGDTFLGFPDADGSTVHTPSGARGLSDVSIVRLPHPVELSSEQIRQLRRVVTESGLVQPFRQLWREMYRPDTVELEAELYSDRYAGHILRFKQFYALVRQRAWRGGFLSGAWDGGQSAEVQRDFPSAGLGVTWSVAQIDDLTTEVDIDLCATDRVVFHPSGETNPAPVAISDVPTVVFSEAMRDMDLFVSVATVANDPVWIEKFSGERRLADYWEQAAHGGMDALIANRREMLTLLYGSTSPGDQFELLDRALIVRGSLATYRIDLATGNVLLESTGKWLSFDTPRPKDDEDRRLARWLPIFDDDEILLRIMVRSGILAEDERLAGRKLLKQIRG
jgi:hypothetical protein